jgi:hypothetical protein
MPTGIIEGVQPRPGAIRKLAANAAVTLARDDTVVSLSSSDAATKVVTMTATQAGHCITVFLRTRSSTGSYTMVVQDGTITLDAANEGALICYDGTNWQLGCLYGTATIA